MSKINFLSIDLIPHFPGGFAIDGEIEYLVFGGFLFQIVDGIVYDVVHIVESLL